MYVNSQFKERFRSQDLNCPVDPTKQRRVGRLSSAGQVLRFVVETNSYIHVPVLANAGAHLRGEDTSQNRGRAAGSLRTSSRPRWDKPARLTLGLKAHTGARSLGSRRRRRRFDVGRVLVLNGTGEEEEEEEEEEETKKMQHRSSLECSFSIHPLP